MGRIQRLRAIATWVRAGLDAALASGADEAVTTGLYGPLCLAILNADAPRPGWRESARKAAYLARKAARFVIERPMRVGGGDDPAFALVLPRLANHLVDLVPLANALRARGHGVVIAGPEAMNDGDPWAAARELAVEAVQPLARCFDVRALDHATPDALRAAVRGTVFDCLPSIVAYRRAVRARLARHRPRVVLIGNPNVVEGSVAGVEARRAGIPSVALQHGTVVPNEPMWWGCPVDHVLAWGEDGRQKLVSCGFSPEAVETVGCLRLDAVIPHFTRTARCVLVASSGAGHHIGGSEQRAFIATVYAAARRTPRLPWVVKLHPKDDPSLYEAEARRTGADVRLVLPNPRTKGRDIFEQLASAAALVTISSAAGLDALAVGVPVISVRPQVDTFEDALANAPFLQAAQTVVGVDALVSAVLEAAAGDRRDVAPVVAQLLANQGRAVGVAADACERIAGQVPTRRFGEAVRSSQAGQPVSS